MVTLTAETLPLSSVTVSAPEMVISKDSLCVTLIFRPGAMVSPWRSAARATALATA